jgi:hypothetical protein
MLLESPIMLHESSIMFLENMYSTGITRDNHQMIIMNILKATERH